MPASSNILFVGAGKFSLEPFQALYDYTKKQTSLRISGIITQPDRLAGRNLISTPVPLKQHLIHSEIKAIPLYQPPVISEACTDILKETNPDLIVVVDYGQFIPSAMLARPKYRCLNIHHSLLPQLRGAVPVPMAIWQGLDQTGTTIQLMDEKMDTGAILAQQSLPISPADTADSLGRKLSILSSDMLIDLLPRWIAGKITPRIQDESHASYCYKSDVSQEKTRLDWTRSAQQLERQIRALYPKPLAWTTLRSKRILIHHAQLIETKGPDAAPKPGQWMIEDRQLVVHTGEGKLSITELQPESRRVMTARDFINGFQPVFL